MRLRGLILLVPVVVLQGCQWRVGPSHGSESLTLARRAAAEDGTRRFAAGVAQDVSQKSPIAGPGILRMDPSFSRC
jgi:hypothetical protein